MKQVISTPKAPAAIGPYSQAISVGNLVYTSGQIPIDPATGLFVEAAKRCFGRNRGDSRSLNENKKMHEVLPHAFFLFKIFIDCLD